MNPQANTPPTVRTTRINVVVKTIDGSEFVSSTQDLSEDDIESVEDILRDFDSLTSFNISTSAGGDKVFFNTKHIVSVAINRQASV